MTQLVQDSGNTCAPERTQRDDLSVEGSWRCGSPASLLLDLVALGSLREPRRAKFARGQCETTRQIHIGEESHAGIGEFSRRGAYVFPESCTSWVMVHLPGKIYGHGPHSGSEPCGSLYIYCREIAPRSFVWPQIFSRR